MRRAAVRLIAFLCLCAAAPGARAQGCADQPLRVAIDVGHSRSSPGATSARGKTEYSFNQRFAAELKQGARGRPLDLTVLGSGSLASRPKKAEAGGAEVFLSIHHDSVNEKYLSEWEVGGVTRPYSDVFSGFSLFVSRGGNASFSLARTIGTHLRAAGLKPSLHHAEAIKGENRLLLNDRLGIYEAPFAVLRHASIPAVLFEVGVILNRDEEQRLEDSAHRQTIQSAVLDALEDYCRAARGS